VKSPKRSISEAIYHLKNPKGDPFVGRQPMDIKEGILFGLGLGLYWGEGSKRGTGGVRITKYRSKITYKVHGLFRSVFSDR
jgi:hypothetical protein